MLQPMPPAKPTSKSVSYRLTAEARRMLAVIAQRQGINMTAALEVLIRQEAERRGIPGEHHKPR